MDYKEKRICFIANNGNGAVPIDGERGKTRTYLNIFEKEHFDYDFIELAGWKKHPISLALKIKKSIKQCDVILLMAATKGTRILIPYINQINKRLKKRFVYSFIGLGPIYDFIKKMNEEECADFMNYNFGNITDKRFAKELKKVDLLLAECESLKNVINNFYGTDNCVVINNFRDIELLPIKKKTYKYPLRLVYFSRVIPIKGIFDLVDSVIMANKITQKFVLDIYGPNQLDNEQNSRFKHSLEEHSFISFKGLLNYNEVFETLSGYDLFCFPSKLKTEGVPGAISDAFLSGLPVLSSNYPKASDILKPNFDCICYEFLNKEDLVSKLNKIAENPSVLSKLSENVLETRNTFTYNFWRDKFLERLFGK